MTVIMLKLWLWSIAVSGKCYHSLSFQLRFGLHQLLNKQTKGGVTTFVNALKVELVCIGCESLNYLIYKKYIFVSIFSLTHIWIFITLIDKTHKIQLKFSC